MRAVTSSRSIRAGLLLSLAAGAAAFAATTDRGRDTETQAIDGAYEQALDRATKAILTEPLGGAHSDWTDPWVTRSENYEVRTTRSRAYGLRMASSLEGMIPIYQDMLGTDFKPVRPFLVQIHPNITTYNRFGDDHSDVRSSIYGGFYAPESPGRAVAAMYNPNRTLELFFLTHGCAQQFLDRAFPGGQHPAVLTQGLGAYFQTFWDYDYMVKRYESLRDTRGGRDLPALASLIGRQLSSYNGDNADARFVQLAMTYTYLRKIKAETKSEFLATNGNFIDTVGPFDDYIRNAVRGEDITSHPIHELLTEGAAELDAEIRAFRGWQQ